MQRGSGGGVKPKNGLRGGGEKISNFGGGLKAHFTVFNPGGGLNFFFGRQCSQKFSRALARAKKIYKSPNFPLKMNQFWGFRDF